MRDSQVVDVPTIQQHAAVVTQGRKQSCKRHRCADVAPDVSTRVDFRARLADVGGVAVELEPEIFHLGVSEGLENTTIELMAGGVGRTINSQRETLSRYVKLTKGR